MRDESSAVLESPEGQGSRTSSPARQFEPGARLSRFDVGVLVVTAIVCGGLATTDAPLIAGGIAFVVGHFFLFCNIFRIRRGPELIWAALFTGLAAATILAETPGWPITFTVSLLATVVLIAIEMRHPSYHGIAWQRVNPDLPRYWREQQGA